MKNELKENDKIFSDRIVRLPEVLEVTKSSKPTIYRMIQEGRFPRQVQISSRSVGWRWSDIENWLANLQPVKRGLDEA